MLILDHNIPQTAGYRVRLRVMIESLAHEKLSGFIIIKTFKCQIASEHVQTYGIYNSYNADIKIFYNFILGTHMYVTYVLAYV